MLLTLKRDLTSDPEWRQLLRHTARHLGNSPLSLSTPEIGEKDMKHWRNSSVVGQTEKMTEQQRYMERKRSIVELRLSKPEWLQWVSHISDQFISESFHLNWDPRTLSSALSFIWGHWSYADTSQVSFLQKHKTDNPLLLYLSLCQDQCFKKIILFGHTVG